MKVRARATGLIDLRKARAIEPWDAKKHGFCIVTRERVFYMQADTADDRSRWIRKLRMAKVCFDCRELAHRKWEGTTNASTWSPIGCH